MLKVTITDTQAIEKFILINIVGLLESIEKGVISIDDAQIALFTAYSISKLMTYHYQVS